MATTRNMLLIEVGDTGFFWTNVEFVPEYAITKGKRYPCEVIENRHGLTVQYTNDIGTVVKDRYDRNSERDGYAGLEMVIKDSVYIERILKLRCDGIEKANEEHRAALERLYAYCDSLLKEGGVA